MAKITGQTEEKIFQIKEWGGLNENPDGDTKLKMGEAAEMRNFRVTRDGNLQRRPGLALLKGLMQSYSLEVSETAEVVRTDEVYSSQLTMFPTATASPDGFVELSGEAVVVTSNNAADYAGYYWRYTDDFNYQFVACVHDAGTDTYTWSMKRVRAVAASAVPVAGLWAGNVGGTEYLVGACDGKLWKLHDGAEFCKVAIGDIATDKEVFMFGYSEKLYLMNGSQYKEWDGTTLKDVEGYRPLVTVSALPASGSGTTLEQVNKLNGMRRIQYSSDGTATAFRLPEKEIASLDYVKDMTTKEEMETSKYTVDLTKGTVTFATAPAVGVNTVEIGYTVSENFRSQVCAMRFAEIFNGANDNRVFLYGDGSNEAFYSGLDYDGKPRADYFPDMNELAIGEANTPITGMIRHYSRLIVYKTNSTYSVQYSITTTAQDLTVPAYYATPVNRAIGNAAPGQVRLVLNSPYTLHGQDLYEWKNNSSYSSNLSVDERQARRISDRITATLSGFDFGKVYCWDDNDAQEYYVCCNGKALVQNYAQNCWYMYTNFPVACLVNFRGKLYVGTTDGRLAEFDYSHRADFGEKIESYWESGAISFERDFMRKYSSMLWVGIKPEAHAEVSVTIQTDKKSTYTQKVVASSLMTFIPADFRRWSFSVNRKPHMERLKIKAKKFVFYKLIFETESTNTTATILSADLRVRYTGYAR